MVSISSSEVNLIPDIFIKMNTGYILGDYQRPRACGEDNITGLMDTILEDAQAGLAETLLGTMIVYQRTDTAAFSNGSPGSSIAPCMVYDIVDGQQRMTAFAIIAYVLEQQLKILQKNGLLADYKPIVDPSVLYHNTQSPQRKMYPTLIREAAKDNYDSGYNSDLAKMLVAFDENTFSINKGDKSVLHALYSATLKWVKAELLNKESTDEQNSNNIRLFINHLEQHCKLNVMYVPDVDSAYRVYESTNSKSVPLTPYESFKVRVIRDFKEITCPFMDKVVGSPTLKRNEVDKLTELIVTTSALTYAGQKLGKGNAPKTLFPV